MSTQLMAELAGPVPVPGNPEDMGKGIQRTMMLLATSTPEKPNPVRILVYGQSISEQNWWRLLEQDLRKRFPNAQLTMENRAIGGFASQVLINPLQHDVYTFYPDLVIFHVYGADGQYRQIIEGIRRNTAAEVLIQKDHVAAQWPDPDATPETNKGMWWDKHMNGTVLPEVAAKFRCGMVDIRSGWMAYLKENNLQPAALLRDSVHLNDDGCALMAGLLSKYLVHRTELPIDTTLVTEVSGSPEMWKDGELTIEFEGNRVDLLASGGLGEGEADVLIDGKKPSEWPGTYYINRPQPRAWAKPVALIRVDHEADLVVETFTMTITKVHEDKKNFDYEVVGSVTGPDGSGASNARFRSNSGRAVIEPSYYYWSDRSGPMAEGQKITWDVVQIGNDRALVHQAGASEQVVTLAQGLPNTGHVLTLKSRGGMPALAKAIRAYRPPVQ